MANFCAGDFPLETSSCFGGGKGKKRKFTGGGGGGGSSSSFRKTARGSNSTTTTVPLGVSQWGRQQLGYPGPPDSHNEDHNEDPSVPAFGNKAGGMRQYQGRGGGRVGGEAGGWGEAEPVRTAIQDLSPHLANSSVVGIVVTKHSIRSFPDKRNPGAERFRFTFTLRDTPVDYINVTCWASNSNYITMLHDSFRICDVVEIVNGQVLSKPVGSEGEDKWNPWTPSPYQINLSETHSTLTPYFGGSDYAELTSLAHAPLRPAKDCHALSAILSSGQGMDGMHVSIIAAVRHVGAPREMTSKTGRQLKKCEVKLMDKDCSSFSLLIWDEELIEVAQTWTPKENIIFAVDVKVYFDSYHNCMSAVCDYKTLIITNPDCVEAYQLYQFSQSVELGPEQSDFSLDSSTSGQDNIQNISEVFSIEGVKERQEQGRDKASSMTTTSTWGSEAAATMQSFTGILYAFLTRLELTGDTNSVVCYRCDSCNFRVTSQDGSMTCTNKNCPSHHALPSVGGASSMTASEFAGWGGDENGGKMVGGVSPHFNLWVAFSDCTGEMERVWLGGKAASDLFQYTPAEFLSLNEDKKIFLKNKHLLEKFKVYFKSCGFQGNQKRPQIKILSLSPADPKEAVTHLSM